jgi:hypothetical protein
MKPTLLTMKIDPDFKKFVVKAAKKKKLSTGGFVKAVLKKHTGYIEKELI